jgi:hypothetical protein
MTTVSFGLLWVFGVAGAAAKVDDAPCEELFTDGGVHLVVL